MKKHIALAAASFAVIMTPVLTTAQSAAIGSSLYGVNLTTGALTRVGSIGTGKSIIGIALPSTNEGWAYALTTTNELLQFSLSNPTMIESTTAITGIPTDEWLVGIDIRPATGVLFAISDASVIYQINAGSGVATAISGQFDPMLEDSLLGFDFNPTVDRIRMIDASGQNLRLNPETGQVGKNPDTGNPTIDGREAYAATDANAGKTPRVVAAAYTNNFAGAENTQLYVIDSANDVLALQAPPNDGVLNTVGSLGVDAADWASFDISASGDAYAILPDGVKMPNTGTGVNVSGDSMVQSGMIVASLAFVAAVVSRTLRFVPGVGRRS